jgi:hypothetical protein
MALKANLLKSASPLGLHHHRCVAAARRADISGRVLPARVRISFLHHLGVGGRNVFPQSEAMPPFTFQNRGHARTAAHNWSANADRVRPGFAGLRASGCLQRYLA